MQMLKAQLLFQQIRRLTWPSNMPASTDTLSVSLSRSNLTLGHSWHSCCVNCWNMPGPSCLVTTLFLQLHFRFPGAGLATGLSRVTCSAVARCERESSRPVSIRCLAQDFAPYRHADGRLMHIIPSKFITLPQRLQRMVSLSESFA